MFITGLVNKVMAFMTDVKSLPVSFSTRIRIIVNGIVNNIGINDCFNCICYTNRNNYLLEKEQGNYKKNIISFVIATLVIVIAVEIIILQSKMM